MTSSVSPQREILAQAATQAFAMRGQTMDVMEISSPDEVEYAIHLARTVSKLSPLLGNTLEYRLVSLLNKQTGTTLGKWQRQDPGFPDAVYVGDMQPQPGIELKSWFPLATEITARFKEGSVNLADNEIDVAVIAWLPDHIIYGRPLIIDVWIDSALSLAQSRDNHYHNPPHYLVFEPHDTSIRTVNLQQTNTNGYVFQGTAEQMQEAEALVASWGSQGKQFSSTVDYQAKIQLLRNHFPYRLDTNFAKMDRLSHASLEVFKSAVLERQLHGHSIRRWAQVVRNPAAQENLALLCEVTGL